MDTPKVLVVVLGMHRSGTSLVTHILSEAGFFVGEDSDLIKAGKWNQKGYFERWSVLHINDRILDLCGSSWLHPPEEKKVFQIELDQTIRSLLNTYNGHQYAVIKDPRLCLTFPVWKRVFEKNIKIILITRHPDAAASSLMKRFGLSKQKCLSLGKVYNERAYRYTKDYFRFRINYEDLLTEKRKFILNRLSSFLEIEIDLDKIAERIVDTSLQHYIANNVMQVREIRS